jgi:electron transport complex protein RnfB
MVEETQIYRDLQTQLDTLPIGFPSTKSGVEIRILKHLFTPEEAKLACQLSMIPEPLDQIYNRLDKKKITLDELERALDQMTEKGSIMSRKTADSKLYSLMPFAVGMFEEQVDRLTQDFARDAKVYLDNEFGDEMYRTKIPQLRTIPVRKSIATPEKFSVSSYDDIRNIIENAGGQLGVINCVCRQTRDAIGQSCTKTDLHESCIVFRWRADSFLQRGIGRAISKDEALAILDKAQEAGLVLQPANTQRPLGLCCCCGDCCGILRTVKRYPRPVELYATNYYAEIDPELCTGCEICISRCQLDAITMVNGVAIIDLDRCIGCGNCVACCEFDASQLRKKETETVPPERASDLYMKIMVAKVAKQNMMK